MPGVAKIWIWIFFIFPFSTGGGYIRMSVSENTNLVQV